MDDAAPGLRSTKGDFMERGAGSLGLICLSVCKRLLVCAVAHSKAPVEPENR
jgi:hypothetical protein